MIRLELHPEIEAQLAAEAHAHGFALDHYIEKIIEARASEHAAEQAKILWSNFAAVTP